MKRPWIDAIELVVFAAGLVVVLFDVLLWRP
jgi:hypothetical protein